MRGRIDSKPESYPESMDVDAAGISVKVNAHYPGRSANLRMLLASRGAGMGWQKSAEGIVPRQVGGRPEPVNDARLATSAQPEQMPERGLKTGSSGRKPQGKVRCSTDSRRRLTMSVEFAGTAVYGTVRMVVWEGGSREAPPYPIKPAPLPLQPQMITGG